MGGAPSGAILAMNRWAIRILGIIVVLMLFLLMVQMLNTYKRMVDSQEHTSTSR
jgi:hypothetical protein